MIIQLLSEEWPLTLKQIHSKLKRRGKTISGQAVHKTLKEMVKNNLLKRTTNLEYKINLHWIYRVEKTCNIILSQYSSKNTLVETPNRFENFNLLPINKSTVLCQQIS